jgi:uncharacterized membrane protein
MIENLKDSEHYFSEEDINNNRLVAAIAYIIFFIPLIMSGTSPFARFHANQGLVLLLCFLVICFISSAIPLLGWLIIGPVGTLFAFILVIIGILNALAGRAKELPFIGKIRIIR